MALCAQKNNMKIYGYSTDTTKEPMVLNEVTFSANPEKLREISEFLQKCANEIEESGKDWEHEHFVSKNDKSNNQPALIVFNPNAN